MSEYAPERAMDIHEELLATKIYAAIQASSNYSERSQQSAGFQIGISDLGYCSEKVRRMVAGIPEPVTDKLAAFIGTALGDHVEQAIGEIFPGAIRQAEVTITLHGDGGDYTLPGHPDVILADDGVMLDVKSTRGLGKVRRTGPSQQQQFQRHCYGLAAYQAGLFSEEYAIDDIRVANVWIDRAGDEHDLYVHMEPLSLEVVKQAAMWVDDLVYAYRNNEPARKEPPREVCAKTCGHFADCRAFDTDVEGLLTAEDVVTAVDMYREGLALERKAKRLKDEAKAELTGVSGSTGKFTVRWVHVNESHVSFTRQPYERLDVRRTD